MDGKNSPEISFIAKGDLWKLTKKDPAQALSIVLSVLLGQHRDFSKDSLRIAKFIESASIEGTENIPMQHVPVIIVCNHPDIYDLVVGTIHATRTYFEKRREHSLPGDIHWLIAENIPPREARKKALYKPVYRLIDWGMKKLNNAYGFTPVPVNLEAQESGDIVRQRAKVLLSARENLKDKPLDPDNAQRSRTVGIFPEGDITGMSTGEFCESIGVLARVSGKDTLILPTKILRDSSNHLFVKFGNPLHASPQDDASLIANEVRESLL